MATSVIKNSRKIFTSPGGDSSLPPRVTILENNEYKITYYEIISGTSGSVTLPTGATINAGEFGLSGNAILSKIDGSNKPTFESPLTAGGVVVTASLNVSSGAWVTSGIYTDANVAIIYSIKIKAINYGNLTYNNIVGDPEEIGTEKIENKSSSYTASSTTTYANTKALVDGLATKGVLSYLDQLVVSGNYMPAKNGYGTTAGTAGLNAYLSCQRISNRKTCIVTSLSVYCNTGVAGGNVRISIWSDLNGLPNTLLVDSGDIVCTSSGRKEAVITPYTLNENVVYHVGVQVSSATINLAYYSVSEKTYYNSGTSNYVLYLLASYAYGAPPATFPAITFYYDSVGFAPYVLLKQQ
jgi:hypothetical protein